MITIYQGPVINLYKGPVIKYHGSEARGTGEDPRGQYGQVLNYLGQKNFDLLSNASLEKLRKTTWRPLSTASRYQGLYWPPRGSNPATIEIRQGLGRRDTNFFGMHEALHRLDVAPNPSEWFPEIGAWGGYDPIKMRELMGDRAGAYSGIFRTW